MFLCWIPSRSSLYSSPSALCLARQIFQDHINKTPVPSAFPLGLANESLGRRSEGAMRVRSGCAFPQLPPWEAAMGWTCPSIQDQCAFPGDLLHTAFFSGSVTAPSPHPFRSRCNNSSSGALSRRSPHRVLWFLCTLPFPPNIPL